MTIVAKKTNPAEVDTPLTNKVALYVDCCDGRTKIMDENGCVCSFTTGGDLSCFAQTCDIPTDNNQLSNGCGYLKQPFGWCYLGCGMSCQDCFTAPVTGLAGVSTTKYHASAFYLTDMYTNVTYTFPGMCGGWIMPVCYGHVYKYTYSGGQSNADYITIGGIVTFR